MAQRTLRLRWRRAYAERWCSAAARCVGDIAAQVETFCRADSVTGQVPVVDGGLAFH